jgi:hypothetical protein
MANVSVGGPIVIFRREKHDNETGISASSEQLLTRELAERAAAKASTNAGARRAHQELAQLCAAASEKRGRSNG